MAKPNTDHNQPKTFELHTFVLSMLLNTVLTLGIGVILGYFLAINIHGDARAAVHQDIQLVSKEVK